MTGGRHRAPTRTGPAVRRAALATVGASTLAGVATVPAISAAASPLGVRGPDGTGRYVCDQAHLRFDACDPDTLGRVVRFPVYDGYTPRHASSATARQVGTSEHGHGTYTVRQGDTLAKVAARFGVSLPVLEEANPHVGPHWIYPGESVTVPTGGDGHTSGQAARTATHTSAGTEASSGADSTAHAASGGQLGARIVAQAKRYLGVPYVWGGDDSSGMDCSGLVQTALAGVGVSAPRTAAAQQAWAVPVSSPEPGDLGFFGSPAHHVVIYAGDGMIIEESVPGTRAHIRAVYGSPQWERVP